MMASPPQLAGLDPSSALLPATGGLCRHGGLSWRPPWSQQLCHSIGKSQLRGSAPAPVQWLWSCSHHCEIPDLIQGSVLIISSEIINSYQPVPAVTLSATHQTVPSAKGLRASHARPCTRGSCSEELHSREDKEACGWLWGVDVQWDPAKLWPLGQEHSKDSLP